MAADVRRSACLNYCARFSTLLDIHCLKSSYDGSLRVWDIRSNRPVHTLADAHDGKVLCVGWDTSGRGIFSGGEDNNLNHFAV